MKLRRILIGVLTSALSAAAVFSFGVSAEDMTTKTKEPALSFDSEGYHDYIHLTRNGEKYGISLMLDSRTAYQGSSLRISADTKATGAYFSVSQLVKNDKGEKVYKDAPKLKQTEKYDISGIELNASDFGLDNFDGCKFTFDYKLSPNNKGTLLGDSVWVYPAGNNSVRITDSKKTLALTVDDTKADSNNVDKFQANVSYSVAKNSNATKLIFEIPTDKAFSSDALYLDNIYIELPDKKGYIKNLDGYQKDAKKNESLASVDKADDTKALQEHEKAFNWAIPVVIIVVVAVVGGGGYFGLKAYKKNKERFY